MRATGSAATCVPVKLGGEGDWEAALFVHVAGPECRQDRRLLKSAREPTPVEIEPKLLAHGAAAIVSMELSIATVPDDALKFEVLLVPGREETHYQAIKLLARQDRICCFFGDNDFRVIQAQEQEIESRQHELFESIARDAFAHDSLLRISSQYDSDKALSEIVSHYSPRIDAGAGATH
ncbi:MAG: hypothetical protein U5R46_07785 [Gammaproteobacteria bacterium]|nr:hypothetical protein [Gammaproteobacteria bacterium]